LGAGKFCLFAQRKNKKSKTIAGAEIGLKRAFLVVKYIQNNML